MTRTGLHSVSAILHQLDNLDDNYETDKIELELLRDLADLARPASPLQAHLNDVCAQAGLQVMSGVFEVLIERESVDEGALSAMDADRVQELYFGLIAPAIDAIEGALS